jgi:thiol-disulfide isomerase/thioredoxin
MLRRGTTLQTLLSSVACWGSLVGLSLPASLAWAQDADRLKQAMAYRPTQKGVEYDQPAADAIDSVRLENASTIGQTGFVVRDAENRLLRRFVDSAGNRKIDTWAYYMGGLEVYRDIDTNADGKPDRFQWLGPAGTRIGVDTDADLVIDRWERVSPQEVTQIVVEAINARSASLMESLLLSADELQALPLEPAMRRRMQERLQATSQKIKEDLAKTELPNNLKWLHFSAAIPGAIVGKAAVVSGANDGDKGGTPPASAEEPLVEVFDHASAIVEVGDKSQQLLVGSLIRVGNTWRILDFPALAGEGSTAQVGGVFFQGDVMAAGGGGALANLSVEGIAPDILSAYQAAEEALREAIGTRTGPALAVLHQRRAQALWKVVLAAKGAERDPWLRQFVDVVSSAYQMDEFPAGLELLEKQIAEMATEKFTPELIAYAEFRQLNAWYSQATENAENIEAVQDQWQKRLQAFVQKYPRSPLTADAMFQLANIDDYLGDVEAAAAVYRKIVDQFPDAALTPRAKGAVIRLTSVGKPIPFQGTTIAGKSFSLAQLKGKTVLIQYWATWCEPCKADFAELRRLYERYNKDGFEIVSVSLDETREPVADYLQQNRLPWTHLFAEGGLEASPLAAQLGVIALPTLIMIDADGKVVDRGMSLTQVERELRKISR